MKSVSKYCIPILLGCMCFSTFAETTKEDFEQFLEQEVSLSALKIVDYKAGDMWAMMLQAHRGEISLSKTEAEVLLVKLIGLHMCFQKIYEKHPYEPDVESAYFLTLDDSILFRQAGNSLAKIIGEDDSGALKLVPDIVCSQYLSPEELKI
ncbi:hypothetical protein [Vibrio vulnificus]|uniref:hypothetical protein n=1 Tax=Vibrio vulnificus TaxID=672 RepID=UPI001558E0D0|nr:hypothetical protein [Vibrio vulnificus]